VYEKYCLQIHLIQGYIYIQDKTYNITKFKKLPAIKGYLTRSDSLALKTKKIHIPATNKTCQNFKINIMFTKDLVIKVFLKSCSITHSNSSLPKFQTLP